MKQQLTPILTVFCLGICILIRYILCVLFTMTFLDAFYMCALTLMAAYFFMKNDKESAVQIGTLFYASYNLADLIARRSISSALIFIGSVMMFYLIVKRTRFNDATLINKYWYVPSLVIVAGMLVTVIGQMSSLFTIESLVFIEPVAMALLMKSLL